MTKIEASSHPEGSAAKFDNLSNSRHDGKDRLFYAPWRDDPGTIDSLLGGASALCEMIEFWRQHDIIGTNPDSNLAAFEFALRRQDMQTVLQTLHDRPELTAQGHDFVRSLTANVHSWSDVYVPPDILRLATGAAQDHQAMWRAHHLRPQQDHISTINDAWLAGDPQNPIALADVPAELRVNPRANQLEARTSLIRWHLAHPGGILNLQQSPAIQAATPADIAYAAGQQTEARQLYLQELQIPDEPSALVGLGLTAEIDQAAATLLNWPHIFSAVQHAIIKATSKPAPPLELAKWLS